MLWETKVMERVRGSIIELAQLQMKCQYFNNFP